MPNIPEISFAGNPVLLDAQGQVEAFLNRNGPIHLGEIFRSAAFPACTSRLGDFSGRIVDWMELPYQPVPAPKISELIWPTGASRFAMGLFLFDYAGMRDIVKKCKMGPELPEDPTDDWEPPIAGTDFEDFLIRPEPDYDDDNDDATPLVPRPSFKCKLRPLEPIQIDHSEQANLWLVPLVCRRFDDIHKIFTPSINKTTTWAEFIDQWKTATGATFLLSSIPSSPDTEHTPSAEAFHGVQLAANHCLDAAALGSLYQITLNPEEDRYEATFASDCVDNAENLVAPDQDRESPDFSWRNKRLAAKRIAPLIRKNVDGRGGNIIPPASNTVRAIESTLLLTPNSTSNLPQSLFTPPLGHKAFWYGRLPNTWNSARWDDYLSLSAHEAAFSFCVYGLSSQFLPQKIPVQVPDIDWIKDRRIRGRLKVNLTANGTKVAAEVDYWGSSGAWEPSGQETQVHDGLLGLVTGSVVGAQFIAEHMGEAGWVITAMICGE
jgi:hypothetical protein